MVRSPFKSAEFTLVLETLVLSIILVTMALLAVLAGWFLSGKTKTLEKRCGKKPEEDSCGTGKCELCTKEKPKS